MSSTAIADKGLAIVMFSEIIEIPNVKGGPKYCMACSDLSVNTSICCRVSRAVIISEPVPIRRSPAVLVACADQTKGFSWSEKRISSGSCTPMSSCGSQPNTMTCLSRSEIMTCFAIVGVVASAPASCDSSTAGAKGAELVDLSQ